jgi:hypothetical protein
MNEPWRYSKSVRHFSKPTKVSWFASILDFHVLDVDLRARPIAVKRYLRKGLSLLLLRIARTRPERLQLLPRQRRLLKMFDFLSLKRRLF